jgi:hypothetical protein
MSLERAIEDQRLMDRIYVDLERPEHQRMEASHAPRS